MRKELLFLKSTGRPSPEWASLSFVFLTPSPSVRFFPPCRHTRLAKLFRLKSFARNFIVSRNLRFRAYSFYLIAVRFLRLVSFVTEKPIKCDTCHKSHKSHPSKKPHKTIFNEAHGKKFFLRKNTYESPHAPVL